MSNGRELICEPHFGGRFFPGPSDNIGFVIMPFGSPELERIYREKVKPTIEAVGLQCFRGDDIFGVNPIMEDVWMLLCRARIVVAEFTGRNANVMYEAGIAHTLGKPLVCLTQNSDDVPFDLRHFRHITYDPSAVGLDRLKVSLTTTIESVMSREGITTPRPVESTVEIEHTLKRVISDERRRSRSLFEGLERRLVASYSHFYQQMRGRKLPSLWRTPFSSPVPAFCKVQGQLIDVDFVQDDGKKGRIRREEVPDFHLTKYPVTNADFFAFARDWGHPPLTDWIEGAPPKDLLARPARVSWVDIQGYCAWLSQKLNKRVFLPTEAMWLAAAGYANDHRLYPWGEDWRDNACNSSELGIHEMSSVTLFEKYNTSPSGCIDMLGNVWEWTSDRYDQSESDEFPWRAVRGGAFYSDLKGVGLLARLVAFPGHFLFVRDIGFRVAYH